VPSALYSTEYWDPKAHGGSPRKEKTLFFKKRKNIFSRMFS
jgi:hypothetical protein